MSLVATVEALTQAGASADMILAVVRAHEAAREAEAAQRRAKAAEKKRRQRADASPDVPGTSRDKPGQAGTTGDGGGQTGTQDAPATCERAQVVTPTSSLRSEGTQEANASFVDASKPADPEKPKTKPPKASRGTRLPEDWEPSDADVEVARSEGLNDEEIRRAAVEFRNYWCSRTRDATKLSWPKTWHNRVADIADRKRRNGQRLVASAGQPGGHRRGAVSFADIFAERHGNAAD